MKFERKLLIDHLAGTFLCALLSAWIRAVAVVFPFRRGGPPAPRAILFVKFVGIGSISRFSFLLRACRQKYPEARLLFLAFPECARFAALYEEIHEVFAVRDHNIFTLGWDTLRALVWCRRRRADWVVDLEVHSKYSSLVSALTGAGKRAGFHNVSSRFRRDLYTQLVYWNPLRHVDESYRQMAGALGLDISCARPRPFTPDTEKKKLEEFLRGLGVRPSDKLLCVNPNSGPLSLERRWPAEHFAQMISSLPPDGTLHVLLLGGRNEKNYVESVKMLAGNGQNRHVHNTAGALSLPMLIELLKKTTLLVTNDSGPLHLADLFETPTLSLWGPTIPELYGPSSKNHKTFYQPIYCSPCVHITEAPPCGGDNQCLKRLPWQPVSREIAVRLGYPS